MTEYSREQQAGAVEAVLFAAGNAVKCKDLQEALELSEEELENLAAEMNLRYEHEHHGIRLIRIEDSYQLCTKDMYYETVRIVTTKPAKPVLTEVMLEVLSIIAYKQPVTRAEIERIRGVASDHAVNRLVEYHLIEEAGRLNAPGRPILFKTTDDFLRAFGVSSISFLPGISEEAAEEAKAEAYKEAGVDMPVPENEGENPEDQAVLSEVMGETEADLAHTGGNEADQTDMGENQKPLEGMEDSDESATETDGSDDTTDGDDDPDAPIIVEV